MTGRSPFAAPPTFPPLLSAEAVPTGLDPFRKAQAAVMTHGVEPGRVYYAEDDDTLRTAIVLAPEMALEDAIGVVFAVALGLSDALGALAPPEVAVHFVWPDRIKVNGALCGRLRFSAATRDPQAEPDWLIVAVDQPIRPSHGAEPGERPDQTTLAEEGCVEIAAPALIESWSRHMLVWINRFLDDGLHPLHEAWRQKCDTLGQPVETPEPGLFVGLDERGGMLLRHGNGTRLLPLTHFLEA